MSCIFCQIASGDIPGEILHRDDNVIVFRDINPQAPVHILIIPVQHIPSLTDLEGEEASILSIMAQTAKVMAQREGIAEKGYRLVVNCGPEGGQLVPHLHMHLLGGRQLNDTMG